MLSLEYWIGVKLIFRINWTCKILSNISNQKLPKILEKHFYVNTYQLKTETEFWEWKMASLFYSI